MMNAIRTKVMKLFFRGRTDSLLHFLVSALLAISMFPVICYWAFILVPLVGLVKEIQDYRQRKWFSYNDMAYNIAGTAYGFSIVIFGFT